jgi:GntR family transcriptional regulator
VEKNDVQSSFYAPSLNKNGFIPLYHQIQQALIEQIQVGQLRVGDCLPSEYELARSYQVSRMTARQALHLLKSRGYALSQKGRGTYVTRPKLEKNIMHLRGFTEEMTQRGMMPSSRLLAQTVLLAKGVLAEQLRVEEGSAVLHLRRLRIADGTPMALEESYIPLKHYPGLERTDFTSESLYKVLRDKYGVRAAWADEVLEASPATSEESELLSIPKNAIMLSISRVIMTTEEIPIEVACSRYHGNRYRASIRVPTTTIE